MKLGFIGAGNLGGSVVEGFINSKKISPSDVYIFDPNTEKTNFFKSKFGTNIEKEAADLFNIADIVFVAVKPYLMKEVLTNIKPFIKNTTIVSLAAGFTLEMMQEICPDAKFIRALTNTPAALNSATTTLTKGENTEEFMFKKVVDLFTLIGTASVIEEKYMDLSTALVGSGPAFFYAVADAFAKGCENLGLDEKTSLIMSAQTMLGAAKMLLNSGKTPETLIREVTTPNGCTAEGLKYMNENNVENLLAKTIEVTTQRAATLAQK